MATDRYYEAHSTRTVMTSKIADIQGLDRRPGLRPGYLRKAEGVDPLLYPALAPLRGALSTSYVNDLAEGEILAFFGVQDALVVVVGVSGMALLYLIRAGKVQMIALGAEHGNAIRTIVPFYYYSSPLDPLAGTSRQMVCVFPDRKCFYLDDGTPALIDMTLDTLSSPPKTLADACVHRSRIFAVQGQHIYASAYNEAANWQLDISSDIGAANAWASTVQSNTRGDDCFTAVTVYDDHVIAFKPHACHMLSGTKNPFRVSDLCAVGCADRATLCVAGHRLLFASEKAVYCYDGDSVREVGAPLGTRDLRGAMACGDEQYYYLYLPQEDTVFVYAPETGCWSTLPPLGGGALVAMTQNSQGCYALDASRTVFQLNAGATAALSVTTAPGLLGATAPKRLCRVTVCAAGADGATLAASLRDHRGRTTPLLSLTGTGEAQVESGRSFSPASPVYTLSLEGSGVWYVQALEMYFQKTE